MEDITGNLGEKLVLDLVLECYQRAKTGSLKLERKPVRKVIYFTNGQIVSATSNDPKDQLSTILVTKGTISAIKMEIAQAQVSSKKPLAKVLTELGYLSRDELIEAAHYKIEKILTDLYTWNKGTYQSTTKSLPKGTIDLNLSTQKLIFTSICNIQNRNWVFNKLGSLETVLNSTSQIEDFILETKATSDTIKIIKSVNGKQSVRQIISSSGLKEFLTCKVLTAALVIGALAKPTNENNKGTNLESPLFSEIETERPDDTMASLDSKQITLSTEQELKEPLFYKGNIRKHLGVLGFIALMMLAIYYFIWPDTTQHNNTYESQISKNSPKDSPKASSALEKTSEPLSQIGAAKPTLETSPITAMSQNITPKTNSELTVKRVPPDQTHSDPTPQSVETKPGVTNPSAAPSRNIPKIDNGRELLNKGNFTAAANAFLKELRATGENKYTITIGLYCNSDNLRRVIQNITNSSSLFILPSNIQGRRCFRIIWGLYNTEKSAANNVISLPQGIRSGDSTAAPIIKFLR